MKATIYKITNTKNNMIYVGQTKQTLTKRFSDHVNHAFNSKRPNDIGYKLYQAMRENGITCFSIEALEELDDTRYKIDQREIYWISVLNSTDSNIGYNVDKGGHVISDKCRKARISQLTGSKLEGKMLETVRENGMKMAKAVCQYDVNTGELIGEYPSIIGASRATGCDRRTIQRQLSGESNIGTAHSIGNLKYIWKYKE